MKLTLELLLLTILAILFYQDVKERKVSLWLLLLGVFMGGTLHYLHQDISVFLSNISINISFILIISFVLWGYAKFKMKKKLPEVAGLGDFVFFILLAISLPILSFLMVFVFSLVFSLIIFIMLKKRFKAQTVPLAGLQSLFFGLTLIANKVFTTINLLTV